MTEPSRAAPPTRRPTPWSVLIAAACVFVVCGWLWNELRKDAAESRAERDAAAARASAAASTRPKILGVDVIPQDVSPSAAPSTSPPPVPSASAPASAAPAVSAR